MAVSDLGIPIYPADVDDTFESIKTGMKHVSKRPTTCREHLESLLSTYVKDTPFKQKDIYDIHDLVVEVGDYNVPAYSKSTMRKALKELRDDGLVVLSQKSKQSGESLWWFAPSLPDHISMNQARTRPRPESKGKDSSTKMPEISGSKVPITHDGRVKQFFVDFFADRLS